MCSPTDYFSDSYELNDRLIVNEEKEIPNRNMITVTPYILEEWKENMMFWKNHDTCRRMFGWVREVLGSLDEYFLKKFFNKLLHDGELVNDHVRMYLHMHDYSVKGRDIIDIPYWMHTALLQVMHLVYLDDDIMLSESIEELTRPRLQHKNAKNIAIMLNIFFEYISKRTFLMPAQNPTLIPDPDTWTDDDFKPIKNTLQYCLPEMRFFCLSSKELSQKVCPYQKLLDQQLYEDLINSYMDPDSEPNENILLPRNIKIDGIIDSEIVNLNIVCLFQDGLTKGKRDGFTPKIFHKLCDGKPNTVTFIKIKGIDEIIGGYNPLKWESSYSFGATKDSFIFLKKNKNINDVIISNVEDKYHALLFSVTAGPYFGSDIVIWASDESTDYKYQMYIMKKA
ncbi:hypothetical protein C1645_839297 [Glomus cerebriforme]|uniref:TLDc domain-containing protein n=1 Tax=Glomus cerebriforme TaxID=658196 RepID=A0A397S5S4_9GLOM|nr:hypothetical protein C1645_839297 [Glomus cerebriforme]